MELSGHDRYMNLIFTNQKKNKSLIQRKQEAYTNKYAKVSHVSINVHILDSSVHEFLNHQFDIYNQLLQQIFIEYRKLFRLSPRFNICVAMKQCIVVKRPKNIKKTLKYIAVNLFPRLHTHGKIHKQINFDYSYVRTQVNKTPLRQESADSCQAASQRVLFSNFLLF